MEELKYYECVVQLYRDKYYSTTIKLSTNTYQLDFRYNTFSESYYLTVYDSVGNPIAVNKEISADRFFTFNVSENGAVQLAIYFGKYLETLSVDPENWTDNMFCVARLIKWEKIINED